MLRPANPKLRDLEDKDAPDVPELKGVFTPVPESDGVPYGLQSGGPLLRNLLRRKLPWLDFQRRFL